MRCRPFEEHELERPRSPLVPELAEFVERHPSEVCTKLAPLMSDERLERIEHVLSNRLRSVVLVLDHLRDPHNRAAILRTAEAMGIQEIHVIQPDGQWPLSRRVTQGCHKWLDLHIHSSVDPCVERLTRRGYRFVEASEKTDVGAEHLGGSESLLAVCLGNEHAGVTETLRRKCNGRVGIPMRGFTKSLNVSVAAALLIGSLTSGRKRGLNKDDESRLRARYYALSVRSPLEVLRRQEL